MVTLKQLLVVLIICFVNSFSIAQQTKKSPEDKYGAVHWTVKEGLAHDQTLCIIKDGIGFLWIGTPNGLSRFDGSTFKNYFYDPQKKGTLAGPKVWGLVEDSLHNIWIGTDKGLSRYDRKSETLSNFFPNNKPASFSTFIIPFWATRDEIFCQESDSFIVSFSIKSFSKKILATLTPADSVTHDLYSKKDFIFDSNTNSIWLQKELNAGLLQIFLSNQTKISYRFPTGESMCYDSKRNSIWTNTDNGLIEFRLREKKQIILRL
jgi:ligand-binding sensor domain-containing protein